jgi:SAM-dependent methyltransferase
MEHHPRNLIRQVPMKFAHDGKGSSHTGDRTMTIILQVALILLGITIVFLAIAWIFVPVLSGLPWIPTHRQRIHKALELSKLHPHEILYDLGAGDGRVLVLAARQFGAHTVGIEISLTHCILAWLRARLNGVSDQVSIRWGNLYKMDLAEADVVFTYLTPDHARRLRPQLEEQLRPGARVVTVSADIDGWEPTAFDSNDLIFLYRMPPNPGDLGSFMMKAESGPSRH